MSGTAKPRMSALWLVAAVVVVAAVIVLENFGGGTLNRLLLHVPGVDKPLHVAQSFAIAVVMFLIAGLLHVGPVARLVISMSAAVLLALFDEWQQQWFGARSIEVADIVAGLAGITLAAATTQMRRAPRLAGAAVVGAVVVAALVTANSYRITKDFNRGLLALEQGQPAAAYAHFLKARQAGLHTAGLYNALAWSALESGAGPADEAVRDAAESVRLSPDDADILDTYGWALHKAGRSSEALEPLLAALSRDPEMYCIHYHLGAAYLATREVDKAIVHLRHQVDQRPDTREAALAAELLRQIAQN